MNKQVTEEWYHGFADEHMNFLGYDKHMHMVPGLIPAKRHVLTGEVIPTGNPKTVPKGGTLITEVDARGQEVILTGLVEDRGAGLAPTGAVSVPKMSDELAAKIAARKPAQD